MKRKEYEEIKLGRDAIEVKKPLRQNLFFLMFLIFCGVLMFSAFKITSKIQTASKTSELKNEQTKEWENWETLKEEEPSKSYLKNGIIDDPKDETLYKVEAKVNDIDFGDALNEPVLKASKPKTKPDLEAIVSIPVAGKIIKGFSKDDLVFSLTMNDWRVHRGIDIETVIGAPVKAIRYGTVENVFEDEENGITVVISHPGDLKSVYSNLQNLNFIEVGRKVKEGDIIGGIGESSVFECADPPHLHFEITEKNQQKDPIDYITF